MPVFQHTATYEASAEDVWAWYDSPGAFRRIMPEWEGIQPVEAGALVDGAKTRFRIRLGPLRPMWVARHHGVVPGEVFCDVMERDRSALGTTNTALLPTKTEPATSRTPFSGVFRSTPSRFGRHRSR